jgi:phthalate 4,5-cis-dihydrodiol dehydrogenase
MSEPLKLGVIGLGRAFTLMLPTFVSHPLIKMVAASDPRADARERFASEFGAKVFEDAEALCADPDVEAVYVASPHQFHVDHVKRAAAHGKHVLVEKPMALSLHDCREMIEAAARANIKLRPSILAHARDDPKRCLRPCPHDQCAQLHRFPLPAAPA